MHKYYSQELGVIKEQNASLQIEVLHLQEEINVTQGKIRKVRNVSSIWTEHFFFFFYFLKLIHNI